MSSAVNTPTTPGMALALAVSIPLMSACARSLNRMAAWSVPAGVMSPTYSASPRTRPGPSLVSSATPMPSSTGAAAAPGPAGAAAGAATPAGGAPSAGAPAVRMAAAAVCTALTAFWYPLIRVSVPSIQARISASLGSGFRFSRSATAMIMPGVEKPFWAAKSRQKASWIGCRLPSAPAIPSMVVTSWPAACGARTRQLFTAAPSRWTVQAPHSPVSQPILVPVRPSRSRSTSTSSDRGSTSTVRVVPLTVSETSICPSALDQHAGLLTRNRST